MINFKCDICGERLDSTVLEKGLRFLQDADHFDQYKVIRDDFTELVLWVLAGQLDGEGCCPIICQEC